MNADKSEFGEIIWLDFLLRNELVNDLGIRIVHRSVQKYNRTFAKTRELIVCLDNVPSPLAARCVRHYLNIRLLKKSVERVNNYFRDGFRAQAILYNCIISSSRIMMFYSN